MHLYYFIAFTAQYVSLSHVNSVLPYYICKSIKWAENVTAMEKIVITICFSIPLNHIILKAVSLTVVPDLIGS